MFASTMAISAFLLLTFMYILSTFLRPYNQSKDVRKRPPGPLAMPIIGNLHMLGTRPHRKLQSLARKYGPIMSLQLGQVQAIVVSSAEAAELFLKTHDTTFASRPKIQASDFLFYGNKDIAFAKYGSYWRNMKKLSKQHLLGPSKVKLFAGLRKEELQMMMKSLDRAATMGEVVNITEKVHGLLEDLVYKMILGRNKDDQFDLKGSVRESMKLVGAFNLADYVPWLGAFDLQRLTQRLKEISMELDQVLEKIMKEHEEAPNVGIDKQHVDFIDILLSLMHQPILDDEQNHEIGRENMKALAIDFIIASSETTAVTIEWALSELLKNPRVMKNLQQELETMVGINRVVEEADLPKLNYLSMVIKETFRLYPVGPLLIPRESIQDVMVNGYFIENKSRIIVNVWAIGRNPKTWSNNADVFYPERFLNSDIDFQGHHFQLLPFGAGRRKCPGIQMSVPTIKLVVAQLVHCFNWKLPCGMAPCDLDMNETFGLTIPRNKPLLALPTHRIIPKPYNE